MSFKALRRVERAIAALLLAALSGCPEARELATEEPPVDEPEPSPAPPTRPNVLIGPTTFAAKAPPPISGGTLLVTRDGKWLFAADPERDQIYVVDAAKKQLA